MTESKFLDDETFRAEVFDRILQLAITHRAEVRSVIEEMRLPDSEAPYAYAAALAVELNVVLMKVIPSQDHEGLIDLINTLLHSVAYALLPIRREDA